MGNSRLLLLALSLIAYQVVEVRGKPMVPAVYIFGDSTADAGNNNHLNSFAKADQWPYGIDFNNVTGRFSNGKTGVDFIAQYLGLPLAPPYLNLSDSQRARITTGINYASGACGILESTRAGDCLSLSKQVKYFSSTARKDLVKALKSRNKVMKHLRKSIFLFSIGYNEYIAQVRGQETKNLTPPQLADTLINHMIKHIKTIFYLGGRKFMLTGISTCEPHQYTPGVCDSRYYADKLPLRLKQLQKKLPGFLYSIYDGATIFKQFTQNPKKFGFTHVNVPCYVGPEKPICADRSKYNQFDPLTHQTERSNEITAMACFNGTACYPLNLFQLAKHSI